MIYAVIQNGVVQNLQVMAPTDFQDPAYTWILIGTTASDGSYVDIGYTYDGTNFTPPQ